MGEGWLRALEMMSSMVFRRWLPVVHTILYSIFSRLLTLFVPIGVKNGSIFVYLPVELPIRR